MLIIGESMFENIPDNETLLREEGRAGFLYAVDSHGNKISSEEAITGDKYFCVLCGCPMHVFKTKTGRHFFGRNPNSVHSNPQCKQYEEKAIKHTFIGDPKVFIGSKFVRVTPRRERVVNEKSNEQHSSMMKNDTEVDTFKSFSSLKQVYEEMLFLDGDMPIGEYKVSDFVITYRTAYRILSNDSDLGARIVYCRYDKADRNSLSLVFWLFSKYDDFSVKFCLMFKKQTDFKHYFEMFETKVEENGKYIWKKKAGKNEVLIAFDNWSYIEKPRCRIKCGRKTCDKCLGLYQADFQNPKQFFVCPMDETADEI